MTRDPLTSHEPGPDGSELSNPPSLPAFRPPPRPAPAEEPRKPLEPRRLLLGTVVAVNAAWLLIDRTMYDFNAFYLSGALAATGADPYQVLFPDGFPEVHAEPFRLQSVNLNPPPLLPVFAVFAQLPIELAYLACQVLSALCMAVVIGAIRPRRGAADRFETIALSGIWLVLLHGQVHWLLLPLVALAGPLLGGRRELLGGALLGLVVAVKPNLLVWPALSACAGRPLPLLSAFAVATIVWGSTVAVGGPDLVGQWVEAVRTFGGLDEIGNGSLVGLAHVVGAAEAGAVLSALFLAGLAGWALRTRPSPDRIEPVGILGAILAAPVGWLTYVVLLIPSLMRTPLSRLSRAALAVLYVPAPILVRWMGHGMGSLLTAAYLVLLAHFLRRPDR